jgi:hypothetical protein
MVQYYDQRSYRVSPMDETDTFIESEPTFTIVERSAREIHSPRFGSHEAVSLSLS